MNKKLIFAFALLSLLLVAACATTQGNENVANDEIQVATNNDMKNINPDIYCESNDDCICGRSRTTAECAFGNIDAIDDNEFCPDFCGGITGKLDVFCINNECKQI